MLKRSFASPQLNYYLEKLNVRVVKKLLTDNLYKLRNIKISELLNIKG